MTTGTGSKSLEILLVEDNPADARITQEVIKQSEHHINIQVVEDGEAAMAYLRREGEYGNSPRPDLILLDLNLPNKSGPEVLAEINGDPNLVKIPVMILTGTEAEQSLLQSYNIPPSRYCRKPISLQQFHRALGQLGLFSRQPLRIPSPETQAAPQLTEQPKKKWWWPF